MRSKAVKITILLLLSFKICAQSDIQSIVIKTIEKIDKSESIIYKAQFYGSGALKAYFPTTSVTVYATPYINENFSGFSSAKLEGYKLQNEQKDQFSVIIVDGVTYAKDFNNNVIRRCPKYRGGETLYNSLLLYYLEGLNDLSTAWKQENKITSNVKINGKSCNLIEYNSKTGYIFKYYIGQDDYLIYKMEATKPEYGGWQGGSIVIEIVESKLSDSKFESSIYNLGQLGGDPQIEYTGNFPAINKKAPDLVLDNYKGKKISLEDYKGKVVLLDFWATWCRPCIKTIPHTKALYQKYQSSGLEILGITYQEKNDPIAFMKKKGVTYPILNGDPLEKSYNLKQSGLPIIYIIDRKGNIAEFILGGAEIEKHLEEAIVKVLKKG